MGHCNAWTKLAGVFVLGSATSCAVSTDVSDGEADVAREKSPIYVHRDVPLFTQNNWVVPVCFKTSGLTSFKQRIRTAIEQTWFAHTSLQFTGWNDCLGTAPAAAVPIEVFENTTPNETRCSGTANPGLGRRFVGVDAQISITAATNNGCLELVAAHEMGHALGLIHEHQRPDRDANAESCASLLAQRGIGEVGVQSGGIFGTSYDPDSVMNYCRDFNRNGMIDLLEVGTQRPHLLSKLDYSGARLLYGFSESSGAKVSAGFVQTESTSWVGTESLSGAHSWNSFGAVANQVTDLSNPSTGVYRVDFPRLAGGGPQIHVGAFGTSTRCKVDSFADAGSTLQVTVRCYNAAGNPWDARFSASVVHGLGSLGAGSSSLSWKFGAYVYADQSTTNSYDANPTYSYNAANLTNHIDRTGTGAYRVTLRGVDLQDDSPFSYELTAVGSGNAYCNIRGHSDDVTETDRLVNVRCFRANGTPVDSRFMLKYGVSTHQTPSFATVYASQKTNPQYTATFTRSLIDNVCNRGPLADPVVITRLGTGRYRVGLPQQLITEQDDLPFGKSIANAVPLPALSTEYCNVEAYTKSPPSVTVACRRNDGSSLDTAFYLSFASLNASNCAN